MHDVVNIKPQVVILSDVTLEATFRIFVESESIVVADETFVLLVFNDERLLLSELSKSINDDTEQDIQPNDLDYDEKRDVVEQLDQVNIRIVFVVDAHCHIPYTTSF